ncbi:MRG family protein [Skeletonema marinoi]|uniref:MRG family protein n=1 Tax=Skeletonema marinoi TaxID=267567 RepID=A0AAD9DAU6_9STRA|nr:MRG family protein [Skeletonema marinoi]
MGWNVKWDRWVDECYLYDHSDSTKLLAEKIQKQYDKVKPKKKGQKMSVSLVSRWMKKMVDVELEHRRLEREGKLVSGSGDTSINNDTGKVQEASKTGSDGAATSNEPEAKDESKAAKPIATEERKAQRCRKANRQGRNTPKTSTASRTWFTIETKRVHADRLTFHLHSKDFGGGMGVISQCGMLYDLPSKVSVRDALNSYLESKLVPMREKKEMDNSNTSSGRGEGDQMEVDNDNDAQQPSIADREKEWVNMVEGIALLFDQALPIHLLFEEERAQYGSLRRQILAQRRIAAYNDQLEAMKVDGVNGSEANAGADKNGANPQQKKVRQTQLVKKTSPPRAHVRNLRM